MPQNPSYQRVEGATRDMRSVEETHVPRGTRRRVPQDVEELRPVDAPRPGRGRGRPAREAEAFSGAEYGTEYGTRYGDEFSDGFQDGFDPELDDENPDGPGHTDSEGRGRRGKRRKDRLTPAQRRRRKIIRRTAGGIFGVFFLVTGYSLYGALTEPGNMSTEARVAEWARGHGMGWAVTWLENQQYQNDKPKTGGNLSPQQLAELSPPTTAEPSLAKNEQVLPAMKPFVPNPAPGEGSWHPTVVINGVPIIQTAQLRSDPDHLQYLSAVAWMDQKHASFVLHPGSQQPGTAGFNQTDHLSGDQLKNLIATWNGAFLLKPNDAHGGFYLNGKTFGKLTDGQASEVFYKDGTINVGAWNSGPNFSMNPNVVGVRQNLTLLVDNGQINPSVDSDDKNLWGVTVKNAYFVWRSGIGITADGNVVYAMGPALSVRTLGELLQRAGAVRAMELDINQQWVSYMTYDGSKDPLNPASTKLLDFARTERRYFSTEERDFVAVYSR
ncbi:phosphodiester glycosidase family protein [Catenulispora subtropica]